MQIETSHGKPVTQKPLISEAEMDLLLAPKYRKQLKGVDSGFWLRHQFLLVVVE